MKFYFSVLFTFWLISSFGQTQQSSKKGHYFTSRPGEYFDRVINPWRYQYIESKIASSDSSVKKIGQIIFWRSEAIYDSVAKNYWRPDISYDIYFLRDSLHVRDVSNKVRLVSSCDSINKGGDIFLIGNFILVSSSVCVHCSSLSNIDYCRKIIKRILESVPDKHRENWNKILKNLIIKKEAFKTDQQPTS